MSKINNKKPNRAAKPTISKIKSTPDKGNHHSHDECHDHDHSAHKECHDNHYHLDAKTHDVFCYGEKMLKISEDINKHLIDYNNSLYLDNVKLFQKLIHCTNINEVVALQANLIKHNIKNLFDKTMNISSELGGHAKELSELVTKNCHHHSK